MTGVYNRGKSETATRVRERETHTQRERDREPKRERERERESESHFVAHSLSGSVDRRERERERERARGGEAVRWMGTSSRVCWFVVCLFVGGCVRVSAIRDCSRNATTMAVAANGRVRK